MTESSEEKAVKLKRNMLLAESDSKQENDSSLTDDERNEWSMYSDALRNLLVHENWPNLKAADWPKEPKSKGKPKRARNSKGQLVGDNPDTPDVNEAWEGGKAPEKDQLNVLWRNIDSSSTDR